MGFVQIIELRTSKLAEIQEVARGVNQIHSGRTHATRDHYIG
jgi:hypothetical protein